MNPIIRTAEIKDLPDCAELYQTAFEPAIQAIFNIPRLPDELVQSVFKLLYQIEPTGIRVLQDGNQVIGFLVLTTNLNALPCRIIIQPLFWRIVFKRIFGYYQEPGYGFIRRLWKLNRDYQRHLKSIPLKKPVSQILTIVIHQNYRGQSWGRKLMEAGVNYWETTPSPILKLEVDEANLAALKLYQSLGFKTIGVIETPRGPAQIMILEK